MILIKPSFKIEDDLDGAQILEDLERIGRTCYKSEDKITSDSAKKFIRLLVKRGHYAMIEHRSVSVRFICDRGVTHEIVRHRLASYAQESTRYCNYKGGVTFIIPSWTKFKEREYNHVSDIGELVGDGEDFIWGTTCLFLEKTYQQLLESGWTPQQARSVLPNSLKTEIVMTADLTEWIHFFKMRASKFAHPQMQELARPLLAEFQKLIPIIFDGINKDE